MSNKELIKCVILTLRKENVIVPNELVAEIVSVKDIETNNNAADWFLGNMSWRGSCVPLLSFEAAGGEEITSVNLNTQAVILYAVGAGEKAEDYPYLGLVMSGVPHVSHFSREQIKREDEWESENPMVAQRIRINGASVSILDIDAMIEMVADVAA
jgi:chemosensory pili system protein ChpC